MGPETTLKKSELVVLDHTGDSTITWDRDNPAEIEGARAMFATMKKEGYMAYRTDRKGDKGEVIPEFDPDAERIILSKPIRGGCDA